MRRGGGGRGRKPGHKGQRRHFSNPDELAVQKEKAAREKQWRQQRGEDDSDEGSENSESESESSSEEEVAKGKGAEGLIEIENPNRVIQKAKKLSQLDVLPETKPELSRREREELEKQQAKLRYEKLHAAGKTEDARADLARLALIRKQREDAAKKRDDEKKAKDAAKDAKTESINKALGKNKT